MAKAPYNRTPGRKARGFRRAGDTTRGTFAQIAGKQGFAEANVLLRWSEIVGEDLSGKCRPVKVTYRSKRSLGATLIVQTDSGRAPEVEHLGPRIVERVNQFYGYRAIGTMKVTQSTGLGVARGFSEDAPTFSGPDNGPSQADATRAHDLTSEIQSPGLRDALARMGAHVLAQSRTRPKTD